MEHFTLFPIEHHDLGDLMDWKDRMSDSERSYVTQILAFFAQSDGIVNENLLERFEKEVPCTEAKYFYRYQGVVENIHAELYAIFIDLHISERDEK
ncbi:hypothetical protein HDU80_006989 [Chytriomyces hyalinus]|nr:hypothetical protein HDU80_006989 [Chytriomyces hyalinus]